MLESLFSGMVITSAIVLALWTDVRLGRAAPANALTVVLHLTAATLAVVLAPRAMLVLGESTPFAVVGVLGVFLPALVYLFLGSIWALKVVQRAIAGAGERER